MISPESGLEIMESLKSFIGRQVTVEVVWYAQLQTVKEVLGHIEDFASIETEKNTIPFIGCGTAIRRILADDEHVLYYNPLISDVYDIRDEKAIALMRKMTFGEELKSS